MSVKLRCLLKVCLLCCLSACTSTNNSPVGVNTQANSTVSQNGIAPTVNAGGSNAGPAANAPAQPAQPAANGIDACSLITTKEVAESQGGNIKEAKNSQRNEGDFLMSQCFYTAEEFVRSVSLTVIQANPANPTKQPKDYFTEKFRGAQSSSASKGEQEKERERGKAKEKKEKGEAGKERGEEADEAQVERIDGLGDQAYWVKTGPSASLYVLKKNQFLILSIGGGDAEPIKLRKTKALAALALKHLE